MDVWLEKSDICRKWGVTKIHKTFKHLTIDEEDHIWSSDIHKNSFRHSHEKFIQISLILCALNCFCYLSNALLPYFRSAIVVTPRLSCPTETSFMVARFHCNPFAFGRRCYHHSLSPSSSSSSRSISVLVADQQEGQYCNN